MVPGCPSGPGPEPLLLVSGDPRFIVELPENIGALQSLPHSTQSGSESESSRNSAALDGERVGGPQSKTV